MTYLPPEIFQKIEVAKDERQKKLDLRGCIIGINAPEIFSEVIKLGHLESLDLSNTGIRADSEIPIEKLSYLNTLTVSNNDLKMFPKWIRSLPNLTSLDISRNRCPLPKWIGELQNLTFLDVSSNHLHLLPEQIGELKNLTSLDLSDNDLSGLPKQIGELRKLTSLDISGNRLPALPEWLGELKGLASLDISRNRFADLPKQIQSLKNLTFLNASNLESTYYQSTSVLPKWIGELKNLTFLDISKNSLTTLPKEISKLHNLIDLRANDNKFFNFPEVIYELTNLRRLSLTDNGIKEISSNILLLENLEHIYLNNNPIIIPPLEITRKGIEGIKRYFRQLEDEGLDYLYEAKLLILGEGGAGKTTLAKKIENPDYQLRTDEDTTKGIDVITWNFTADNQKPFRANIWDFGGQEIYHTTHQFFLTKRSLYILVADTRKEDTDFYYWLNVVELLSDNSPLLIVKNEKQERHRDINERQLRGEFDNLKETLAVNLATNRGLTDVLDRIQFHLTHLEHIGSPLPKTWLRVRAALENDPRNYIPIGEYFDLCEQNGFSDSKDKMQLIGYLHDLGVCLHFQGDPLLRKTVILKPEWGTDAVYMVLDNRKVINSLGKFDRSDLAHIWQEGKYLDMREELLQLMINFKLCYRIPDGNYYIAPQLLTENQPTYQWDEKENLLLRYTYEFMPKGIITQFIVVMHRLISEERLVWRSGVVLEREQTRAEVIEHYGRREIRIRVNGQHKKEVMAIVNYELDKIHASYKRLKYKRLVPCNCEECKDNQEPHFFTLDTLKKFYGDRQELIQCQNSYDMVSVRGLIDEVAERETVFSEARAQNSSMVVNIFEREVESVEIQQAGAGSNIMTHNNKVEIPIRNPWVSGSFYLFVFAVVICGLGVLANTVPPWVLPVLLIAGVIFVPVIGALQLKQDERLSDKSFLKLMRITVGQLPLIRKLNKLKA